MADTVQSDAQERPTPHVFGVCVTRSKNYSGNHWKYSTRGNNIVASSCAKRNCFKRSYRYQHDCVCECMSGVPHGFRDLSILMKNNNMLRVIGGYRSIDASFRFSGICLNGGFYAAKVARETQFIVIISKLAVISNSDDFYRRLLLLIIGLNVSK